MTPARCPHCRTVTDVEIVDPFGPIPCPICGHHSATLWERSSRIESNRLGIDEIAVDFSRLGDAPVPTEPVVSPFMELALRLERAGRTVITGECLRLGMAGAPESFGVRSRPLQPFGAVLQSEGCRNAFARKVPQVICKTAGTAPPDRM